MHTRSRRTLRTMLAAALAVGGMIGTATGASAANDIVFADMDTDNPGAAGWYSFGGEVGGGGIGPSTDVPPSNGGTHSLGTGWGSGGVPGFYGGFGLTNPTDIAGADAFSFWINPNADQNYTLEINLIKGSLRKGKL